jgi:S1 RNA binding domain protein
MNYDVGLVTEGTIVEIAKFGAFVKLAGGKTGLVHISEISDKFVQEVGDYVNTGDRVIVKVISIDEKKRLQLSMKAVTEEEAEKFRLETEDRQTQRRQRQEPYAAGRDGEPDEAPPDENPGQTDRPERPADRPERFERHDARDRHDRPPDTFETKLKMFMRQSEDRLVDVKRGIESKRGGKKRKR